MNSALPRMLKLLLLAAAALLTLGARNADRTVQNDPIRIYVPNQMGASISIFDGDGRLLETLDLQKLGFSAHAMPHQVAVAMDGAAWYVALAGDGWVLQFDRDNELVAQTPVAEPGMLVLDAGRDLLYVSRALASASPPRSLAVLRASDLRLLEEIDIFIPRPHALAVDTVSGRVYTGSLATNEIAAVDFASGVVHVTDIGGAPQAFVGLAVSPDGSTVVATTQLSARLLAFDAAADGALHGIAEVEVEALPYDVAYSPDGRFVWFPNQLADAVTRVDTDTWRVGAVIRHPAFAEPHGVVISPDGATIFVTSHGRAASTHSAQHGGAGHDMVSARENGTMVTIDAHTGEVLSVGVAGPYAAAPGLAVVKD